MPKGQRPFWQTESTCGFPTNLEGHPKIKPMWAAIFGGDPSVSLKTDTRVLKNRTDPCVPPLPLRLTPASPGWGLAPSPKDLPGKKQGLNLQGDRAKGRRGIAAGTVGLSVQKSAELLRRGMPEQITKGEAIGAGKRWHQSGFSELHTPDNPAANCPRKRKETTTTACNPALQGQKPQTGAKGTNKRKMVRWCLHTTLHTKKEEEQKNTSPTGGRPTDEQIPAIHNISPSRSPRRAPRRRTRLGAGGGFNDPN